MRHRSTLRRPPPILANEFIVYDLANDPVDVGVQAAPVQAQCTLASAGSRTVSLPKSRRCRTNGRAVQTMELDKAIEGHDIAPRCSSWDEMRDEIFHDPGVASMLSDMIEARVKMRIAACRQEFLEMRQCAMAEVAQYLVQ